jgi:hypothetical protein
MLGTRVPEILSDEYQPTPVHDFLLKLTQYQVNPPMPDALPYPCIVTTCFDQVLEQHFRRNGVPFHLVAYEPTGSGGQFEYTSPNGDPHSSREIRHLNNLMSGFTKNPVIIKLIGGGRRPFVVTEDNYIDYLNYQTIETLLPMFLLAKLRTRRSRLLFLGYNVRYLGQRTVLRRLWSNSMYTLNKRWTVIKEKRSSEIDVRFWQEYGLAIDALMQVDSFEVYMKTLTERISLPSGA